MSRINVDAIALTDGRFKRLAELLGLADADHARAKVEYVWLACTIRGELELPRWVVEQHLGPTGPEALVDAELARWTSGRGDSNTRRMYICGARGRTEWFTRLQEQSSKAGKSRARKSSRVDGKFTSQVGGAETSPLTLALAPAHAPEREEREARSPDLETLKLVTDEKVVLSNERLAHPRPLARDTLNHEAWTYAAQTHARLKASGLDRHALAWTAMPSGAAMSDLVARTREILENDSDPHKALEVHRRRIDVAAAEAQRPNVGHLKWFTPSRIYNRESFWKAAEMTPEQVRRSSGTSTEPTLVCSHGDEEEAS